MLLLRRSLLMGVSATLEECITIPLFLEPSVEDRKMLLLLSGKVSPHYTPDRISPDSIRDAGLNSSPQRNVLCGSERGSPAFSIEHTSSLANLAGGRKGTPKPWPRHPHPPVVFLLNYPLSSITSFPRNMGRMGDLGGHILSCFPDKELTRSVCLTFSQQFDLVKRNKSCSNGVWLEKRQGWGSGELLACHAAGNTHEIRVLLSVLSLARPIWIL